MGRLMDRFREEREKLLGGGQDKTPEVEYDVPRNETPQQRHDRILAERSENTVYSKFGSTTKRQRSGDTEHSTTMPDVIQAKKEREAAKKKITDKQYLGGLKRN